MLYGTQARESRRARPTVERPLVPNENPVRRYLGNRSIGPGLWKRPSLFGWGAGNLRFAH